MTDQFVRVASQTGPSSTQSNPSSSSSSLQSSSQAQLDSFSSSLSSSFRSNVAALSSSLLPSSSVHEDEDSTDLEANQFSQPLQQQQPSARMKRVDDVSKKLGEKMLLGWTLMDLHCPSTDCACPLMRDKKGMFLCVSCNTYYEKQEASDGNIQLVALQNQQEKQKGKENTEEQGKVKAKGKEKQKEQEQEQEQDELEADKQKASKRRIAMEENEDLQKTESKTRIKTKDKETSIQQQQQVNGRKQYESFFPSSHSPPLSPIPSSHTSTHTSVPTSSQTVSFAFTPPDSNLNVSSFSIPQRPPRSHPPPAFHAPNPPSSLPSYDLFHKSEMILLEKIESYNERLRLSMNDTEIQTISATLSNLSQCYRQIKQCQNISMGL